jgi:hypothetical protein
LHGRHAIHEHNLVTVQDDVLADEFDQGVSGGNTNRIPEQALGLPIVLCLELIDTSCCKIGEANVSHKNISTGVLRFVNQNSSPVTMIDFNALFTIRKVPHPGKRRKNQPMLNALVPKREFEKHPLFAKFKPIPTRFYGWPDYMPPGGGKAIVFVNNAALMVPDTVLDYETWGAWTGRRYVYQNKNYRGRVISTDAHLGFAISSAEDIVYFTLMGLLESDNVARSYIRK